MVGTTLHCDVWVLIAVASAVADHRLEGAWTSAVLTCRLSSCSLRFLECGLSSCGTRAELLQGMWDLPRPGVKPMSPALASKFLTTEPPAKSDSFLVTKFSEVGIFGFILLGKLDKRTSLEEVGTK